MKRYPDPVLPPDDVINERNEREQSLIKASVTGISLRTAIIFIELFGYLVFSSSALLADALASLVDVASTFFLILCIRLASRPPDRNHPFGHGRFEPLAGLQLGILLVVLGTVLFVQQGNSLATHENQEPIHHFAWLIPVFAVVLLELAYQWTMHASEKYHSPALAADAWHYRLDALNSLVAAVALGLGAIIPSWSIELDFIGAMSIAILMVVIGVKATKGNLDQLLDKRPDPTFFALVKKAALRVQGVQGTEKMRIQQYGPDAHVDIDVEVDPKMSVDDAHVISQQVRVEIQKDWPAVRDVTVHIEPFYPNDH